MRITLRAESQTAELGKKIANNCKGGEMILLTGDMGAGKTTLTKGIALGLGIDREISSPTFALLNIYRGRLNLYHYDLFRLESFMEAEEAGLCEYFGDNNGIAVIEWSELLPDYILSKRLIRVDMKYLDEETREAIISVNFEGMVL